MSSLYTKRVDDPLKTCSSQLGINSTKSSRVALAVDKHLVSKGSDKWRRLGVPRQELGCSAWRPEPQGIFPPSRTLWVWLLNAWCSKKPPGANLPHC